MTLYGPCQAVHTGWAPTRSNTHIIRTGPWPALVADLIPLSIFQNPSLFLGVPADRHVRHLIHVVHHVPTPCQSWSVLLSPAELSIGPHSSYHSCSQAPDSVNVALDGQPSKSHDLQGVRWVLGLEWTRGDRPCSRVCPIYMPTLSFITPPSFKRGQVWIQLRDDLLYSLVSRYEYMWQTFS